jgi:hypothetical protein
MSATERHGPLPSVRPNQYCAACMMRTALGLFLVAAVLACDDRASAPSAVGEDASRTNGDARTTGDATTTADASRTTLPEAGGEGTPDVGVCPGPDCCTCPANGTAGVCVCGDASYAVCADASNGLPCNSTQGTCMGCFQSAGNACTCSNVGDGLDASYQWQCYGTEQACTGGTP